LEFASAAGDNLPVGDDGPRGFLRGVLAVIHDAVLPRELSGLRIERVDEIVDAGVDDEISVDREVAVNAGDEEKLRNIRRQVALVFPDEIAGGAVDCLHQVARIRQIEDAAISEWRGFLNAWAHAAGPDHSELSGVGAVDLIERAIAP